VIVDDNIGFSRGAGSNFLTFISGRPDCPFSTPSPADPCWQQGAFQDDLFIYDGQNILHSESGISLPLEWYPAQFGDILSDNTLPVGRDNVFLEPNPLYVGSADFYLAIALKGGFPDPRPRRAFGWIHFRPVDGRIEMVSNVMAYNVPGLIVGMSTVVPEPTTAAIILAILAISVCERRNCFWCGQRRAQ
jgi:hypothetical protein